MIVKEIHKGSSPQSTRSIHSPALALQILSSYSLVLVLGIICGVLIQYTGDLGPIHMDELSQLTDRIKNKWSIQGSRAGHSSMSSSTGPQISAASQHLQPNYQVTRRDGMAPGAPPPVPPRPAPNMSTRPPAVPNSSRPANHPAPIRQAGALYDPGHYPTPELPNYPLQKSRVLSPSSPDEFTSETIQKALDEMGPSSTLYLIPRSLWRLNKTIALQDYQELATLGYPDHEEDMAILDAQESCTFHLIHAMDKSGVRIRNLVLEGNKEKYGWLEKDGGVMVQLGGGRAYNQVCLYRPRHVRLNLTTTPFSFRSSTAVLSEIQDIGLVYKRSMAHTMYG